MTMDAQCVLDGQVDEIVLGVRTQDDVADVADELERQCSHCFTHLVSLRGTA